MNILKIPKKNLNYAKTKTMDMLKGGNPTNLNIHQYLKCTEHEGYLYTKLNKI